jgi:hypothetical protein
MIRLARRNENLSFYSERNAEVRANETADMLESVCEIGVMLSATRESAPWGPICMHHGDESCLNG